MDFNMDLQHKILRKDKIDHLNQQIKNHKIIYISAQTGFGKTTLVCQLVKSGKIKHEYISAKDLDCKEKIATAISKKIRRIVIDDIHVLMGQGDFILDLISKTDESVKFIIIGRCKLPGFLMPFYITGILKEFTEEFMALTKEELDEYCQLLNHNYDGNNLEMILEITHGWFIAVTFLLRHNVSGKIDKDSIDIGTMDIFQYFDYALFDEFDTDIQSFLLHMAHFEYFNINQAKMVYGSNNVDDILLKIQNVGSFLDFTGRDGYHMIPLFRKYLIWKRKQECSTEFINNCYDKTALYYTLVNDIPKALKYYSLAGKKDKIADILIANANNHAGNGYFKELKQYYFDLPMEIVEKSPELMSAISIIYSMCGDKKKSEEYYTMLQNFAASLPFSDKERSIAVSKLLYLKIALPHRKTINMIDLMKSTALLLKKQPLPLQIASVTGNMPSIMNGGKDFCSWSKRDRFLYATLAKPVMAVLGDNCAGLPELSIGESLYEKNHDGNFTEELTFLNVALSKIETSGNLQMTFATLAILSKIFISQGKANVAMDMISSFNQKIDKTDYLKANVDCFYVSINLIMGNLQVADEWLATQSPNEYEDFFTTDRYAYLTKAKVYITKGMYLEALSLLKKLDVYFNDYDRVYCTIEADIMKAIIFYQQNDETWRHYFTKALKCGAEYKFIRVISMYGAAILPMLTSVDCQVDPTYLKRLTANTQKQGILYPKYLKEASSNDIINVLTETETNVLKLACDGLTNNEIAEILYVSPRTVKFHLGNIYSKLDVNGKLAAVQLAKENKMF